MFESDVLGVYGISMIEMVLQVPDWRLEEGRIFSVPCLFLIVVQNSMCRRSSIATRGD